jgi:DNA-binding NarL/FixJ family response regulator
LLAHIKSEPAGAVESHPSDLLSKRELEVLKMAAKGIGNKDIGEVLFISVRTVHAHMRSVFNKLGVGSRSEAIICGLRRGYFTLQDVS